MISDTLPIWLSQTAIDECCWCKAQARTTRAPRRPEAQVDTTQCCRRALRAQLKTLRSNSPGARVPWLVTRRSCMPAMCATTRSSRTSSSAQALRGPGQRPGWHPETAGWLEVGLRSSAGSPRWPEMKRTTWREGPCSSRLSGEGRRPAGTALAGTPRAARRAQERVQPWAILPCWPSQWLGADGDSALPKSGLADELSI